MARSIEEIEAALLADPDYDEIKHQTRDGVVVLDAEERLAHIHRLAVQAHDAEVAAETTEGAQTTRRELVNDAKTKISAVENGVAMVKGLPATTNLTQAQVKQGFITQGEAIVALSKVLAEVVTELRGDNEPEEPAP